MKILPEYFQSYRIAAVDLERRKEALIRAIAKAKKEYGGVVAVVLDGVADFILDPNDPIEAFGFVAELHKLAIENECAIILVLHENPNSEAGKTRGHLGSQLERKAESNIRLVKQGEMTIAYTEKSRHCHIPKDQGSRFKWDDDFGMHLTVKGEGVDFSKGTMAKGTLLSLVPMTGTIEKSALLSRGQEAKIGVNKCRGIIADLVHDGILLESEESRPRTQPKKLISRKQTSQPGDVHGREDQS